MLLVSTPATWSCKATGWGSLGASGDEGRPGLDARQGLPPRRGRRCAPRVDEDALAHFVPVELGDSAHEHPVPRVAAILPELEAKLRRRGIPGVFRTSSRTSKAAASSAASAVRMEWASPCAAYAGSWTSPNRL